MQLYILLYPIQKIYINYLTTEIILSIQLTMIKKLSQYEKGLFIHWRIELIYSMVMFCHPLQQVWGFLITKHHFLRHHRNCRGGPSTIRQQVRPMMSPVDAGGLFFSFLFSFLLNFHVWLFKISRRPFNCFLLQI